MVADSTQEDQIEDAVEVVIGDKNLATAFEDQSDDEIEEDDLVVEYEGYSAGSIVWIKVGRLAKSFLRLMLLKKWSKATFL